METKDIYDQEGHPLTWYDPTKGYLKDGTRTVHHDAVEGVEEQGHWVTVQEYPNGGRDVDWIVDVPGVEAKEAWDEEIPVYVYTPYAPEEASAIDRWQKDRDERRAFDSVVKEAEVMLLRSRINTLSVDDVTALRWRPLYPKWELDTLYQKDVKVQYNRRLYKCIQEHTSQTGWEPTNIPAIWTEITETHSGSIDDPIPYNNNMELENGKYYTQDGVKYHCTRDTRIPVYNPLKDLVGIYVEVVE